MRLEWDSNETRMKPKWDPNETLMRLAWNLNETCMKPEWDQNETWVTCLNETWMRLVWVSNETQLGHEWDSHETQMRRRWVLDETLMRLTHVRPEWDSDETTMKRLNKYSVWKTGKFTLTKKIFREIIALATSLVKALFSSVFSRNFCHKHVRFNFCDFHTVQKTYLSKSMTNAWNCSSSSASWAMMILSLLRQFMMLDQTT